MWRAVLTEREESTVTTKKSDHEMKQKRREIVLLETQINDRKNVPMV